MSHGGAPAPTALGQASLSGCKIEVRTVEEDEKDAVAKARQARSKLYFVGTDADWAKGTITRVCEPSSQRASRLSTPSPARPRSTPRKPCSNLPLRP